MGKRAIRPRHMQEPPTVVLKEDALAQAEAIRSRMRSRIEDLEEALEFYADREKYKRPEPEKDLPIEADSGEIARRALISEGKSRK